MPTVSYGITNTADDVTYNADDLGGFQATLLFVGDFVPLTGLPSPNYSGFRFPGVAVPAGATINSATLTLKRNDASPALGSSSGGSTFGAMRGLASDDAPSLDSSVLLSGTKTTASVTITNGATIALNVASIVQEVVGRSGWASGNALAFLSDPTGANGFIELIDRAASSTNCAQLSITYTAGGPTSYTLTAAAGLFTLSGQAAGLKRSRRLSAAAGAFTLTGRSALLTRGRRYIANAGTFALVGQSAALKAQRAITGGAGAVALTGFAVGLRVTRVLPAIPGAYVLSGQPALFETGKKLVGSPGAFALSGKAVNLVFSRRLPAEVGAFVLNGQDAALDLVRKMGSEAGAFVITGADVGLKLGRRLPVEAGQYVLAGSDAGFVLDQGGNVTLSAEQGVFLMAFGQASFRVSGWSPVPPATETWTTVPKASETWTPVPKTPEIWS